MNQNKYQLPRQNKGVPPMDFQKIQKEQQQKQIDTQNKISLAMAEDFTLISDLISEENYEKLKNFIMPTFAKIPASTFKVGVNDYLELFLRIFDKDEKNFNLIEIGMLADMIFQSSHDLDDKEDIIELLKFRVDMLPLFIVFNEKRTAITNYTIQQMESSIPVIQNSIIKG